VRPLFLPDYIQNVTARNLLEYSYVKLGNVREKVFEPYKRRTK